MATLKKGLGRGLDALLDPLVEETVSDTRKVSQADIRSIDTNKQQPRQSFNEDALNELAASIKVHGIVQPLIVKKTGDRYLIVAGERRFRAARIAGMKTVPVITVDYDETQIQEIALIENIQRENLNPIEEASAIRFLMKQHDLTQEEVSSRLGKSRPAVANTLRLLNLPPDVMEYVKNGTLSAGHGRAIAGVADEETQKKLAQECIRLGYSVRALESRIQNLSKEKQVKVKTVLPAEIKRAERLFREKIGTKVKIDGTKDKGKVTIDYYSADDLQKIYDCILGGSED